MSLLHSRVVRFLFNPKEGDFFRIAFQGSKIFVILEDALIDCANPIDKVQARWISGNRYS